jgi:hypothetical protein
VSGDLVRFDISRFRDVRDKIPAPRALYFGDLAELLAPEFPPVMEELVDKETSELELVDWVALALQRGGDPPDHLRSKQWVRNLMVNVHVAGEEDRDREVEAGRVAAKNWVRASTKQKLPLWSPARFCSRGTRRNLDVESLGALVLDYDDGTTFDAAMEPWCEWKWIAATTWSHSESHPRFRIIIPLQSPVPASRWSELWRWAEKRAVGAIDPQCKDLSRAYLLPAVRASDSPYRRLVHDAGVTLLSWASVLAPASSRLPGEPGRVSRGGPVGGRGGPTGVDGRRARRNLQVDEGARYRAAVHLGAEIAGTIARKIRCPGCDEASVWFFVPPGRQSIACCNHKNSCGWKGRLDQLLNTWSVP